MMYHALLYTEKPLLHPNMGALKRFPARVGGGESAAGRDVESPCVVRCRYAFCLSGQLPGANRHANQLGLVSSKWDAYCQGTLGVHAHARDDTGWSRFP